ncbi:glycosyltransferase family 90 protein, partial [Lepidopterella palustris CBS 459.81]
LGVGGYVANWTRSTNPCVFPEWQGLHGGFVRPENMSASQKLFPFFGASKFAVNNDILLPSPSAWNTSVQEVEISAADEHQHNTIDWKDKANKLWWRGPATGGHNTKLNWQRFHRHRFVSMLNSSHATTAEQSLHTTNGSSKGVAAADMHCDEPKDVVCPYHSAYFSRAPQPHPDEQARYKFAAVLDGNGGDDGGKFLRLLKSAVLPIKASVYRNWYDNHLWPWVHFVPVDMTFVDFVWPAQKTDHDDQARQIATAGREWANKVLRKEDMLVYVYRLLLEYARVVDDKRERLGWVWDLVGEGK